MRFGLVCFGGPCGWLPIRSREKLPDWLALVFMLEPVALVAMQLPRSRLRCSHAYQDGKGESGAKACLALSAVALPVAGVTLRRVASALRQAFQKRIFPLSSFSASKKGMFSSTVRLGNIDYRIRGR
jgi:hypothetical protein